MKKYLNSTTPVSAKAEKIDKKRTIKIAIKLIPFLFIF
jgi:hypothetical protein